MQKKYILIIVLASFFLMYCKKGTETESVKKEEIAPQNIELPTLTTTAISNITTTSAKSGGIVSSNGGAAITDRGLCFSEAPTPTIAGSKTGTVSVFGSGEFTSDLAGLKMNTKYYVRAYATNKSGTAYGNEISFTTNNIAVGNATLSMVPMFVIGSTLAFCEMEVNSDGGDAITERGLCWALTENPTLSDTKVKHNSAGLGKYKSFITGILERTNYHVRAYAINAKGVSYSSDVAFKTIGKGRITYTFNKEGSPTSAQSAAYARLQVAVDSAAWYLSNYTSAVKHVTLNYVDGVATADANSEGWMRFGTNSTYQNIRTMLHEMNHTLGTGTSSWWTGKIVGGKFQGTNTNEMLKKIQRSTTDVQLSGDTQHWWPYGLNQNSEVTSSWDYVYNCLIIEAMRKDGLTQYSGAYTP